MTRFSFWNGSRWLRDFLPLLVLMALIFTLSSQSVLVEIQGEAGQKTFYKTSHILAYALLAWLWWRALAPQRAVNGAVLGLALLFTVFYGISDEVHQRFVPGRNGQVADVLFDASGALLMIILLRWFKWLRIFPETFLFPRTVREIEAHPNFVGPSNNQ